MKKIALLLVIVLVFAAMSVMLFACTTKVAGKDWELESFDVTGDGLTEEQIATIKTYVESIYKDAVLTFNKDGTMEYKMGSLSEKAYYVQDGKNIYVSETEDVKTDGDPEFTVEGKKIIWEKSDTAYGKSFTVKMTIVQKK